VAEVHFQAQDSFKIAASTFSQRDHDWAINALSVYFLGLSHKMEDFSLAYLHSNVLY
jgi:hypothetical protein